MPEVGQTLSHFRIVEKIKGDGEARSLLNEPFFEEMPRLSPDERWMAYVSNESGSKEVYVRSYPGLDVKKQISEGGGLEPIGSSNGKELFYRSGKTMFVVEISTEPEFNAGPPRVLFQKLFFGPKYPLGTSAITQDDRRFLMLKASTEQTLLPKLNIILNWFEELKEKVPVP